MHVTSLNFELIKYLKFHKQIEVHPIYFRRNFCLLSSAWFTSFLILIAFFKPNFKPIYFSSIFSINGVSRLDCVVWKSV